MAIDFSFPPEVEDARQRMRAFVDDDIRPTEGRLVREEAGRADWRAELDRLRERARVLGLWNPHMPAHWDGAGLGPTALAAVSAEAARSRFGSYVVNCYAPDEGNMHTLLHWGTEDQKDRYLRPMCEGRLRSCFAMTEPEVAGSDPTLMQTRAVLHDDEWVVNGHKWFISGARGAAFAILLARTEDDPGDECHQCVHGGDSACLVATVTIATATKVAVARRDRGERFARPQTPWPLVQPLARRVPKPTSTPAVARTDDGADQSTGPTPRNSAGRTRPSKNTGRQACLPKLACRLRATMPLMPATRPFTSMSNPAAAPIRAPPATERHTGITSPAISEAVRPADADRILLEAQVRLATA